MQKVSERRVRILFAIQLIGLLLGIVCIVWMMIIVSSLLRKLSNINILMEKYARGDISERIEISKNNDELDDTLSGVNHLGENITAIVSEIHAVIRTLQNVSVHFFSSFDSIVPVMRSR
jgi:methyl-accepting chemotaxis protein